MNFAPLPPVVPRRRWPKVVGAISALLVLTGLAVGGYAYWRARHALDALQQGPKRAVVQSVAPQLNVAPPVPAPGIGKALTVLAVGADHRAGEADRGRSDTMMLVRVDPQAHVLSILSLPRDLQVPIPGYGLRKLNDAYALGGAGLLAHTIRDYLGVTINHYVEVSFLGFQRLVNDLGGILIPVDARYFHVNNGGIDNWSAIDLQPGYQRLSGSQALSFVRFRHRDSDFTRAARQQLFVREVGRQIQARQDNLAGLPHLLDIITHATTSDLSGVLESIRIAHTLYAMRGDHVNRVTLQATGVVMGGVDYLQASPSQKRAALEAWAHPGRVLRRQHATSHAAKPKPAPELGLQSDGGQGLRLLAGLRAPLTVCAPTRLPSGYTWGSQSPVRAYRLGRFPAVAGWMSAGSGHSALWMWTTWADPPILHAPSQTVRRGGRSYNLYWDSGHLRMVSWHLGVTRAWLTNTLNNDLSARTMLALAASCRRIAP